MLSIKKQALPEFLFVGGGGGGWGV
jgi:hypothetical protein